jgi:death-on-curing protein
VLRQALADPALAEAAAPWESLSQNHPFIDGNKRTAFSSMNRFLALNDMRITASPDEAYEFISGAFERQDMKFDVLDPWLRANTQAREP